MIGAHGPVPASASPDIGVLLLEDGAPTAATEQEGLRSPDDGETSQPLTQVGTGGWKC